MNVTLGLEHLTANERPSRIPAILEPLSAWIQSEGARAALLDTHDEHIG